VQDASKTKEQLIQELAARADGSRAQGVGDRAQAAESQREAALEALRESEAKLRYLIEHSADAIVLADEQGAVIEWNQSARNSPGCAGRGVGRPLWMFSSGCPQERQTPAFYEEHKGYLLRMLRAGYAPEVVGQLREQKYAARMERAALSKLEDFPCRRARLMAAPSCMMLPNADGRRIRCGRTRNAWSSFWRAANKVSGLEHRDREVRRNERWRRCWLCTQESYQPSTGGRPGSSGRSGRRMGIDQRSPGRPDASARN